MTENRKQWAAVAWPEMPAYLPPEAIARRAKVRIGIRVALLTLPLMLAAGFAAIAGHSSGPHYDGYKTAQAVMVLTKTHDIVTCDDTDKAAGAVSDCAASPSSAPGLTTFEVTFVDNQGNFTVDWPNGRTLRGTLGA